MTNRFPRNKNGLVKHMLNPMVSSKSETSTRSVLRSPPFILPIDESLVFCVTVYVIKRSNKNACTHTYTRRTVIRISFKLHIIMVPTVYWHWIPFKCILIGLKTGFTLPLLPVIWHYIHLYTLQYRCTCKLHVLFNRTEILTRTCLHISLKVIVQDRSL